MPKSPALINYFGAVSASAPLTPDATPAFICFVFSDEARRAPVRARRQRLPLRGRHISYGVKPLKLRGSDRTERVYVAVTALQRAGLGNYQACCEVAAALEFKLGESRRGRPRGSLRPREFADKVETVRSIYNSFKLRHPWKEKLPECDLVYELWYGRFRFFLQWVADTVLPPMVRGMSGQALAEQLALRGGEGGRITYEALTSLGEDGFIACLSLQQSKGARVWPALRQIKRFATEFFGWKQSEYRKEI